MNTMKHDFAPVVHIEELAPEARFSLRVRPAHRAELDAALGLALPQRIGERVEAKGTEAVCLGPDEWLILTPDGAPLLQAAAAVDVPHSLCEISDREITLRLSGPQVLDLLATGCPRDISALKPGSAVRTPFESATVILWRDGAQEFRMDIWRSFAPHVRNLLDLAQTELQAGL